MDFRTQLSRGLLLGFMLLLAACGPPETGVAVNDETSIPQATETSPNLPPEAVLNAQQWLAMQLGTAVEQIQIRTMEQVEWTDSCLGLGRLNEGCLQVVTPGWRVIFEVSEQSYEVRTDETGSMIRLASPLETPSGQVALENIHWKLIAFGPPGTNTPLVEGSTVTLVLADGQAVGMGGCNAYGALYRLDDSKISFDEITRTLKACENEFLTAQEQNYLLALESANRYELDGTTLRIWYENGAGVLVFETQQSADPNPTAETPAG